MATEAMIRSVLGGLSSHVSSPSHPKWRDWSNLADGPAGLIAERLLANDVADYIRFRAVCCQWQWRQFSMNPRAHSILDRRFHPRNWIMLRETVAATDHRRLLLNVSTGQCIRVRLPELLRGHCVSGRTSEGLLVLLDRTSYVVRILSPLTYQVTDLPPATTLLRRSRYEMPPSYDFMKAFEVSAAGIADDSTFAVYFRGIHMLAIAKPGDQCWKMVDDRIGFDSLAMSFQGRFYFPTDRGLMVVKTSADQPPRLVLAAELTRMFSRMSSTIHLVDNGGELIVVYRNIRQRRCTSDKEEEFSDNEKKDFVEYMVYRVDLNAMNTKHVLGLGGRAIFIGLGSALSVSTSVFPSIKSDSIYLGLDLMLETSSESNGLYCLTDGSTEPCGIIEHGGFDEECGSEIGPWGIDDYLSLYVTDTHQVGSLMMIKSMSDDD